MNDARRLSLGKSLASSRPPRGLLGASNAAQAEGCSFEYWLKLSAFSFVSR